MKFSELLKLTPGVQKVGNTWEHAVITFLLIPILVDLFLVKAAGDYCFYSNCSYTGTCMADAPHNLRLRINRFTENMVFSK